MKVVKWMFVVPALVIVFFAPPCAMQDILKGVMWASICLSAR